MPLVSRGGPFQNGKRNTPFFLGQIHLEFTPKIFGNIHTDEKVVHVKKKLMYDINSIDSKTKYILAHSFLEKRTEENCRKHFLQIRKTNGKQIHEMYLKDKYKPNKKRKLVVFVSDGFHNYKNGAIHYFYRTARIIAGVPIACKKYGLKHNNNPIEKYNQDIGDQIKTKRGFGSFSGAEEFLNLRHVVKNFVNPHMSLNGRTPAEAAGINLMLGRQRLLNLIKYERLTHITLNGQYLVSETFKYTLNRLLYHAVVAQPGTA